VREDAHGEAITFPAFLACFPDDGTVDLYVDLPVLSAGISEETEELDKGGTKEA
jgi:hypothetical protein